MDSYKNSDKDVKYRIGNIVNNVVVTTHGYETSWGNRFIMSVNV